MKAPDKAFCGKGIVSVFDLDFTLLSVNSSYHFGTFLYRNGVISFLEMLKLVSLYARHKVFGMSTDKLHHKVFYRLFKGRSVIFFRQQVERYLDEVWNNIIYLPGFRRLVEAQQQGQCTVILSNAPNFLVESIANRFSVDEWEATVYGVDSNKKFSSIVKVMNGRDKAQYLCDHLKPYYEEVHAYSDSILDLPFLEAATVPVGVNPDQRLRAICRNKNWKIIDES